MLSSNALHASSTSLAQIALKIQIFALNSSRMELPFSSQRRAKAKAKAKAKGLASPEGILFGRLISRLKTGARSYRNLRQRQSAKTAEDEVTGTEIKSVR